MQSNDDIRHGTAQAEHSPDKAAESHADQPQELRRCVRDLVALSSQSAYWSIQDVSGIAENLADTLQSMLRAEIAYVKLKPSTGTEPCIALRENGIAESGDRQREIEKLLAPYLDTPAQGPLAIPDPVANGSLSLITLPVGSDVDTGFIAIASRRSDFPTYRDQLIYHVAANQAAMAISRRNQIEAALTKRYHTAVMEERNRLAREMHDTLAQGLTGIVVQLQVAERTGGGGGQEWRSSVHQALSLADDCLREARRSVKALRSAALVDQDLQTALKRMVEQMTHRVPIRTECLTVGNPYALPPEEENSLLRIAQEAVTNALRHAGAGELKLTLSFEPNQVLLRIEDDGAGFDTSQSGISGYGLKGMQERSDQINARLSIVSGADHGTTIEMTVPRDIGRPQA